MTDNSSILFQYLKIEDINIDKEEFIFQFKSHSEYPSLLAICDTLNFFSISNGAIKLEASDIDLLPNTL